MQKIFFFFFLAICVSGCSKGSSPAATAAVAPSAAPAVASSEAKADGVQQKLADFAGGSATDCGRLSSQADDQMKAASACAMDAAQGKHPFYVAYDLPGMTVGVAGNAEGKLFTVQASGSADV